MNYFNYAIKCVIRNIIYKLMKPKILIPLLVGIIGTFLLANYTSVFGWEGTNTYTDKNATIMAQYDSINQDIVNRLNYYDKQNNMYQEFISYLRNNNYSYYAYYGSSDGSSMTSSSYFATQELYVKFYDNETKNLTGTVYDTYQGMTTNIMQMTGGIVETFVFDGNTIVNLSDTSFFYLPSVLVNYKSSILYALLNDTSSSQSNDIVSAINQQTNSINQQTNTIQQQTTVIQETQDFVTNSTVQDSTMSIDTTNMSVDESNVDNFFTGFFNTVKNAFINIDNTVETVTFPVPFTDDNIILYSDVISKHIINTPIYTILQAFYWFIFGRYIIIFVKRILDWLSTGKMADEGVFSFIEWMDVHNEIIKSYML